MALIALGLGVGLLVERAGGARLAPALLVPVGTCGIVVVSYAVFRVGAPGAAALVVVVLVAAAGFVSGRAGLRERLRPGPMALAAAAVYALHLAPVFLTGRWTWAGYNFVNDTSVQLLLAQHLGAHGLGAVPAYGIDTAQQHVAAYLRSSYPVGAHGLLATIHELVPLPLAALYQPLIAALAALVALGLGDLARSVGLRARTAALAGFGAAAANLFYQYGLQGNVKEVAFLAALVAAVATGHAALRAERPERAAVVAGVCAAAAFLIYSGASGPYLLALGAALALAAVLTPRGRRRPWRRLAVAAVAAAAAALVLAAPGFGGLATFNRVAGGTFAGTDRAADLGQLLGPLPRIEAAGVWLGGDYRKPVEPDRKTLNAVLCAFVLVLGAAGVVATVARRRTGLVPAAVLAVLTVVLLIPRLSPYAGGKVLALASPLIVFAALVGAWSLRVLWPPAAAAAAALVLGAVLYSDALAYHVVKLAPVGRLDALHDIGDRFAGERGLVMLNEPEEYAKNVIQQARVNEVTQALTPRWVELRRPRDFVAKYFDLDEQTLRSVESYPVILKRRSPDASRPPANYRLVARNRWYEGWRRTAGPRVVAHLPLQRVDDATARAPCRTVRRLAARAQPGDRMVAARRPVVPRLDVARVERPAGWIAAGTPGLVIPTSPGRASTSVDVAPGRYQLWIAGSFGRRVQAWVDGRRVGGAAGVNNLGQWLPAGTIALERGRHRLAVSRAGGNLAPGNGYTGQLGPLALEPERAGRLVERPPSDWRGFCGRPFDWIELVR